MPREIRDHDVDRSFGGPVLPMDDAPQYRLWGGPLDGSVFAYSGPFFRDVGGRYCLTRSPMGLRYQWRETLPSGVDEVVRRERFVTECMEGVAAEDERIRLARTRPVTEARVQHGLARLLGDLFTRRGKENA